MLGSIATAIRRRDHAGYRSRIATGDAAFLATADRLFANLAALPLVRLSFRLEGVAVALDPQREAALPGGWTQQGRVTWQLSDDAGPAEHQVWLTFVPRGGSVQLAGLAIGPPVAGSAGGQPHPLWMLGRLQVARAGGATVVVADGPAERWLQRAQEARAAVWTGVGAAVLRPWTGGLVLEVPASESDFEQVLGGQPGSYRQIAAVSRPEGPDPATAAIRIVVNPALAEPLPPTALEVLLTHEATHVATRAAASRAPMWLVEGFADYIAYDRVRAGVPPAEGLVRSAVAGDPGLADIPPDAAFSPDKPDLAQSYALAWAACRFIAQAYSPIALQRLYAAADAGQPLSAAIPRQLGVTRSALLASWRAWLTRTGAHG